MIYGKCKVNPVLTRRSIRKFTHQRIPAELVRKLLQAGMSAPSAEDERPWHFVIITDSAVKKYMNVVHPDLQTIKNSPLLILVCGDLTKQKAHGFWVQDCAASTENILIEAQLIGLGGVWLGIYPIDVRVQSFRQYFKLPDNIVPFSIIPIGYPNELKEPIDRYDEGRIHYQVWDKNGMLIKK